MSQLIFANLSDASKDIYDAKKTMKVSSVSDTQHNNITNTYTFLYISTHKKIPLVRHLYPYWQITSVYTKRAQCAQSMQKALKVHN